MSEIMLLGTGRSSLATGGGVPTTASMIADLFTTPSAGGMAMDFTRTGVLYTDAGSANVSADGDAIYRAVDVKTGTEYFQETTLAARPKWRDTGYGDNESTTRGFVSVSNTNMMGDVTTGEKSIAIRFVPLANWPAFGSAVSSNGFDILSPATLGSGSAVTLRVYSTSSSGNAILSTGSLTVGTEYTVSAVFNRGSGGRNGACELWVNGSSVASSTDVYDENLTATSNIYMWRLVNATVYRAYCRIARFIVSDQPWDATQRATAEAWVGGDYPTDT